jgi:hypothetical protein
MPVPKGMVPRPEHRKWHQTPSSVGMGTEELQASALYFFGRICLHHISLIASRSFSLISLLLALPSEECQMVLSFIKRTLLAGLMLRSTD